MFSELFFGLFVVCFFHLLEMFFTYKILSFASMKYSNPEVLEVNFHRFFVRRFGVARGLFFSTLFVSLPFLSFLVVFSYFLDFRVMYVVIGMVLMISFVNFVNYRSIGSDPLVPLNFDKK